MTAFDEIINKWWPAVATVPMRLVLALFFGAIIGIERGKQGRAAGMRTHILVCIGSALASMMGFYATEVLGMSNDPLRVAAQVVSGISFLGVGTILLKGRFQITGLTTAAGIWCAATIGIALGVGYYEGAIVTFLASVIAVTLMHRFEYKFTRRHTRFGMYIEIVSPDKVKEMIVYLHSHYRATDIQVTPPRSGITGYVGIEVNIHPAPKQSLTPTVVAEDLEKLEYVIFSLESI